jgi:hypothetical protein
VTGKGAAEQQKPFKVQQRFSEASMDSLIFKEKFTWLAKVDFHGAIFSRGVSSQAAL